MDQALEESDDTEVESDEDEGMQLSDGSASNP